MYMLANPYTITQLQDLIETEEKNYNNPIENEADFLRIKNIYNKVRELKIDLHTKMKLSDELLSLAYKN